MNRSEPDSGGNQIPSQPEVRGTCLPEGNIGSSISVSNADAPTLPVTPGDTHDVVVPAKVESHEFLKTLLAPAERPGDLGRLGDYLIRGVLGAGGMGIVLTAEDPILRRNVAIKLMRPEIAATPDAKERFLREARSIAAVEHPRIVVIHYVGEWKGAPFLVMPLMAGRSLGARLKQETPVSIADATRLIREAADGLAAAHAKALIHRDIKPDNIWLEETAEGTHVRLLDFGLARGDDSPPLTITGGVVGTPNYMAPEQAAGELLDHRADLFSLGCVLYELLAGQKAFPGRSILAVLGSLARHHPTPVQKVVPTVPASLSILTMRLLEKSREQRPASAAAVSEEFRRIEQEIATGWATVIVPPAPSAPVQFELAKWKWAVAGLLGVLVVGGLISLLSQGRKTEPNPNAGNGSLVQRSSGDSGGANSGSNPGTSTPLVIVPLRVMAIDVRHFASSPQGDVPQGSLGKSSFTPSLGDRVQVTASLSKPGYAYLIAFRPDGQADLCFPQSDDIPPPLTDTPRYPLTNTLKAYGLREGTGLWVFAVVASETPLPAYREWLESRSDRQARWKPVTKIPSGIVWWDDGQKHLDAFTANGLMRDVRGKDETLEGPAEAIRELTDSLRTQGQEATETTSAFGFCVVAPRN